MRVCVTGGAGYIGSHTVVSLIEAGHDVVVLDNFTNSSPDTIEKINDIVGKWVEYRVVDMRRTPTLIQSMQEDPPDAVIHFAGLKAVGESFEIPVDYYDNNVCGTVSLLNAMKEWGTQKIIFSSSATVYGQPSKLPIPEDHPLQPTNPYGTTKLVCEWLIQSSIKAGDLTAATILRYFNPVGAHPSGTIGELPKGAPNNLAPYVSQVAHGWREKVSVFGSDWPTPDGTGVRDYIHVMDLAAGHVASLDLEGENILNLGTGKGTSVLEMISAFENACGKPIPHVITARRQGDISECVADPSKALNKMGWSANMTVEQMAIDAWRWQQGLDGENV